MRGVEKADFRKKRRKRQVSYILKVRNKKLWDCEVHKLFDVQNRGCIQSKSTQPTVARWLKSNTSHSLLVGRGKILVTSFLNNSLILTGVRRMHIRFLLLSNKFLFQNRWWWGKSTVKSSRFLITVQGVTNNRWKLSASSLHINCIKN